MQNLKMYLAPFLFSDPAFYEIVRPISLGETPRANSDLMSRSIVTVGSPASILAIRDWLELTMCASCAWVRCLLLR